MSPLLNKDYCIVLYCIVLSKRQEIKMDSNLLALVFVNSNVIKISFYSLSAELHNIYSCKSKFRITSVCAGSLFLFPTSYPAVFNSV